MKTFEKPEFDIYEVKDVVVVAASESDPIDMEDDEFDE